MGMDLVAVRWTQLGMGNSSHAWDTVGNENGRTRNGSLPLTVLIVVKSFSIFEKNTIKSGT